MNETGYLIIDLEATCCDAGTIRREETEIIEIGAVVARGRSLEVVDEFSMFASSAKRVVGGVSDGDPCASNESPSASVVAPQV